MYILNFTKVPRVQMILQNYLNHLGSILGTCRFFNSLGTSWVLKALRILQTLQIAENLLVFGSDFFPVLADVLSGPQEECLGLLTDV